MAEAGDGRVWRGEVHHLPAGLVEHQFREQFDAGLPQRGEAIRRLQVQRQRRAVQQVGDRAAHQAGVLRRRAARR